MDLQPQKGTISMFLTDEEVVRNFAVQRRRLYFPNFVMIFPVYLIYSKCRIQKSIMIGKIKRKRQ